MEALKALRPSVEREATPFAEERLKEIELLVAAMTDAASSGAGLVSANPEGPAERDDVVPAEPTSRPPNEDSGHRAPEDAGIAVPIVAGVAAVVVAGLVWVVWRRRKRHE